jgi:hypothetical protein
MKFNVSITYKDLFEDFSSVNEKDLIADIPSKDAIQLMSFFLAQIHLAHPDEALQVELIEFCAQRFPAQLKSKIRDFTTRTVNDKKAEFTFISNLSGLIFIETILENYNELDTVPDLTPEQELNFFKAYLLSTQKWIDRQAKITHNIKPFESGLDFVKAYLPSHIAFDEFHDIKDFRIQFMKAKYFFEFCESHSEFKEYLKIFLQEYNLDSWKTYLKNILSLYVRKFERLKTPSVLNIKSEHYDQINFLKQLSLDLPSFTKSDDFLQIREKPVLQVSDNDFVFLNLNFFVDKIYQGIQFDFAQVLVKNSATFKGKVIKSRVQFLSIFGEEFSETVLFYKIMEYCFGNSGYILKQGNELKQYLHDGEPDYYIRDKAKVYLFEFKNVFLSGNVKHTLNYEEIKAGIYEKLVENSKGHDKGVKQLANVIAKIKNKDFNAFDNYDFDGALIYPIIVFTDSSFSTAGVNYLLNEEFQNVLTTRDLKRVGNMKKLIMINLDEFIKYQDLFKGKKIKLNNLLNGYLEFTSGYTNFSSKFTPFEIFIENKTNKLNSKLSENAIEEIANLLGLEK